MNLLSLLVLGFFLGMRHATDPDHVVAVATIVARERSLRGAGRIGALWGVGHTLTVLVVGGAMLASGLALPPRLGLSLEFLVAVMLVVLGAMNLMNFRRGQGCEHSHDTGAPGVNRGWPGLRPLLVGGVHGLAGSAAVALLVLGAVHNAAWGLLYLGLFGLGTVFGMMAITLVMSAPVVLTAQRFALVRRHVSWLAGLLSVGLGLFLMYEATIEGGLFSAQVRWEPK